MVPRMRRPVPPGSRAYRTAVRLLPRAHREQFGDDQVRLYEDLVASGTSPWRLWLDLPRDLAVTSWWARGRRRLAPQPAGGPGLGGRTWTWGRAARTAAAAVAVAVHVGWLAAHLAAGVYYRFTLLPTVASYGRDGPGDTPGSLDDLALVNAFVDRWALLALAWLLVPLTFWALPRKPWFVAAWAVLWPLGMALLWGAGSTILD